MFHNVIWTELVTKRYTRHKHTHHNNVVKNQLYVRRQKILDRPTRKDFK